MKNQEKGADIYISVIVSSPCTTNGFAPLYRKLYHLPLKEALSLVQRKVQAGYAVQLCYAGDDEVFFQPLGLEVLK